MSSPSLSVLDELCDSSSASHDDVRAFDWLDWREGDDVRRGGAWTREGVYKDSNGFRQYSPLIDESLNRTGKRRSDAST